jgi:hypothetical protein
MPFRRNAPVLGLVGVLGLTLGSACASEPDPVFVPLPGTVIEYRSEAVVTDEIFERDVEVLPEAFRIAKNSASASLAALKVGNVVVAEYHPDNPRNREGMLRRVIAVQDVGELKEFATEEADILDAATNAQIKLNSDDAVYDLRDWAEDGVVQLLDPGVDPGTAQVGTKALDILADPPTAKPAPPSLRVTGKNGSFSISLKDTPVVSTDVLVVKTGASLTVKPGFHADINLVDCKYHGWALPLCADLRNLDFVGEFNFKPKADIKAEASLTVTASSPAAKVKKSKEFVKPKTVLRFAVAGIPMTLSAGIEGTCEASASVSVEAKIAASAEVHPEAELGYSVKGGWKFTPDLDKGAKLKWEPSIEGKAGISAKCSVQVKLELRIAGIPVRGPHASLGPYIKGDTKPNCLTRVALQPGVAAAFGVDESQLNLKLKKFTLPQWEGHAFDIPFKSLAKEVGLVCQNECVGKPDGYLCTPVPVGSVDKPELLMCTNEQVVTRAICPTQCVTPVTDQDKPVCK